MIELFNSIKWIFVLRTVENKGKLQKTSASKLLQFHCGEKINYIKIKCRIKVSKKLRLYYSSLTPCNMLSVPLYATYIFKEMEKRTMNEVLQLFRVNVIKFEKWNIGKTKGLTSQIGQSKKRLGLRIYLGYGDRFYL